MYKRQVQDELQDYSEKLLRDTANGYTTLTNVRTSTDITSENNEYVLLPVWLVTYRSSDANKKVYYYAMNGQTGKFIGNLPISWKSVLKFWSIVFLASSLISIIFGLLMTHNIF